MRLLLTGEIPPAPTPTLARVSCRVNAEWGRWAACAVPANWPAELHEAGTLDGVVHLIGVDRSVPMAEADRLLATLVAHAATDHLAARVVLQRLVAPLVAVARRRARLGRPIEDVFADLLAQAWIAIRTYPIVRRPVKIAANLVRDIEYQVYTRPARLRSASEVPCGGQFIEPAAGANLIVGSGASPAGEALAMLRDARLHGAKEGSVDLLWRVHLDGVPPEQLAAELGVTERTVRNRRHAAYRELAGVA